MNTLSDHNRQQEPLRPVVSRACARWILASLIALGAVPSNGAAHAQTAASDDGAVKELMRRGYAALKKNDVEAAHSAFSEAWKKKRHFAIALSLAEVEMRLGRYVEAADHWQFVIRNLPDDLADKRADAEQQLVECKTRVGTLTVQMKPLEATLIIDGAPTLEPPADRELYVNPGDHDIRAEKDGKRSPTRSVHLSAGAKLSLELVVDDGSVRAAPAMAVSDPGGGASGAFAVLPPAPRRASSLKVPVIVSGLALTVGGATLGTVFLLKSNSASDDAQTAFERAVASVPGVDPSSACAVKDRPSSCDEAEARVTDQRTHRNVAVGAYVGTGVAAVATVAALLFWPSAGADEKTSRTATLTPGFAPGFASLSFADRF
jgi:tetratricopeptide (TPR) repeat protein